MPYNIYKAYSSSEEVTLLLGMTVETSLVGKVAW